MSRNVLVTGGAGFLGSHFTKNALSRGWDVTVVDNFSTCNVDNLDNELHNAHLKIIRRDICDPLPREISETPFDLIVNLASPASPPRYQRLAEETLRVGTVGVMNMVTLARKHKAQLFHASTSEVYGDPTEGHHPQTEDYWGNVNSYGERSCYDESKRAAEAILWSARHPHASSNLSQVDTNIVRIFNTYGPHMDPEDGRVVSNFIMQALRGDDIT
ncbi:MAG TPA: NAD-dependent epimerase/dehydratase family protein, partial [Candidatus Saccharibacteria bacterium]|nr:NAD-dependent epimerase/dehydratase family protein [Candidatus Saccharibacteria bacterium]